MQFEWTTKLSEIQLRELKDLYSSLPLVHIEQFPQWNSISKENIPLNYCIAKEANVLQGYAMVYEFQKIEARVLFGPIALSGEKCVEIILEITRYYKAKNFLSLQVLLGMGVGVNATHLQYSLYKKHKFKLFINKFNKATLILRLDDKTNEQLLKHFSENHRRAIKKAEKNNLACKKISTIPEIVQFAEGYTEMFFRRGMKLPIEQNIKSFVSIFEWLKIERKGFFMGVFEKENMIGGILILFRGDRAEYYRGFTLPDERKIPIGHLSFYEAMKLIKEEEIPYFDFGGYNMLVGENDQVYQINKFKKGFHGEEFFYPPILYFDLKPFGTTISRSLKKIKKSISKVLM